MKTNEIIEEIRLELTGGVVELELDDNALEKIVNKSLRELNKYCIESRIITMPFSKCIDMSEYNVRYIANVYREKAIGNISTGNTQTGGSTGSSSISVSSGISTIDPMISQWAIYNPGYGMSNFNNWILNYEAAVTMDRIANTMTTDLAFMYDKDDQLLYINTTDNPSLITIRFVPYFNKPEELKTEFWKDLLIRMCVAYTKIIVGRIRSKFTQGNALWTLDGETLLEEGNTELTNLQEILRSNSKMTFPLD